MSEWKIINGYPDYAISPTGDVKSLRFNRLLKASKSDSGYQYVNLVCNKMKKTTAIHKIVIEHFGVLCPAQGWVVDHKDGNKINNNIENLEWVTVGENTSRFYGNFGKKIKVKELRAQGWTMQKIATELGVSLGFVQDHVDRH